MHTLSNEDTGHLTLVSGGSQRQNLAPQGQTCRLFRVCFCSKSLWPDLDIDKAQYSATWTLLFEIFHKYMSSLVKCCSIGISHRRVSQAMIHLIIMFYKNILYITGLGSAFTFITATILTWNNTVNRSWQWLNHSFHSMQSNRVRVLRL